MPSTANATQSGLRLTSRARQYMLGERKDCADTEFDFDTSGSEGCFGLQQWRIIRIMSVIQLCFLLGFAHAAMYKQAPSPVWSLTEESLPSFLAAHPEGILVNFHTATCSHCLKLAPEFEAAAHKLSKGTSGSNVALASVDVAISPKAAVPYGITHLPSMIWFRKGLRVQDMPPNARTSKQIVDFVAWASGPAIVEFTSRIELEESLPELRAALPVGGPPVIVGFAPILAGAAAADKPAVKRQDVYDALEIAGERLRGETVFLYIQESWTHDPSVRAYFRDAAADRTYNGTVTADSLQAWAKGLLGRKSKK